jgi:glucose-6-phosphate isomerase
MNLREEFDKDTSRVNNFSIKLDNLLFDYSKNLINNETKALLIELAGECGLKEKIEEMFSGVIVNRTEERAVLHTALRDFSDSPIYLNGVNIKPMITDVRQKMKDFCDRVHKGDFTGSTGKKIRTIVNIGIGGSDLGPAMVCDTLKPYSAAGMSIYFVSNVDCTHISETLKKADPETTLFVVASKTFTTQETLTNANTAKEWLIGKLNNTGAVSSHFIALSTNEEAVREFGIDPNNMFGFWDWVGGRYSLWSAIGMSIALYLGYDNFELLLKGAWEADKHFRNNPFDKNIPVLMALLGIWYTNYYGASTHAVIPYDQYMARFPEFLQQLDMESNGKTITLDGEFVEYRTGPVIWGAAGTNAQHSFFQLIHQGSQIIPADFIAPAISHNDTGEHHKILLSNFFAQTEALMKGKNGVEVIDELKKSGLSSEKIDYLLPHKIFLGNKPTNSILVDKITPFTLGMIIAFYEHKVFTQGAIWNINSFDQWGVELGKQLAKKILPELSGTEKIHTHDSSTNNLINTFKEWGR